MAWLRAAAAALLALLAAGAPARGAAAPPAGRSAGAGALFSALDHDGDGKVTWREVETSGCCDPWPTGLLFEAADSNGDGAVVPEEFHATAGALRRRQAESQQSALGPEAWEESLLRRGRRLAALRATASAEGNATEAAPRTTLDSTVGDKAIWLPSARCEKYTMRSCVGNDEALESCIGNSTCADTGDCVCGNGMCASTWIGHCVECEQKKKEVRLGLEDPKCIHKPELENYSSRVPGDGTR